MNSRPFQNEEKKATRLHEQIKQLNKENETETDSKKKRVRSDEISSLIDEYKKVVKNILTTARENYWDAKTDENLTKFKKLLEEHAWYDKSEYDEFKRSYDKELSDKPVTHKTPPVNYQGVPLRL